MGKLKWTIMSILLMAMSASAQMNRLDTLHRSNINHNKFTVNNQHQQQRIEDREDWLEEVPMDCHFHSDTVKVRAVQDCGRYEGIISAKVTCNVGFTPNVRFDVLCADDDRNLTAEECVKESFFNFADRDSSNNLKHLGWQHGNSGVPSEVLEGGNYNLGDQ